MSSNPPTLQTFTYETPGPDDALKQVTRLCASENLRASVQVIQRQFRETLHSHRDTDGLWIVLRGRVSFFGPDDVLLGDFGRMEGIFIPRNCRYRYESTGEETLEVLQVLSAQGGWEPDRTEHAPRSDARGTVRRHDARHLAETMSETAKQASGTPRRHALAVASQRNSGVPEVQPPRQGAS